MDLPLLIDMVELPTKWSEDWWRLSGLPEASLNRQPAHFGVAIVCKSRYNLDADTSWFSSTCVPTRVRSLRVNHRAVLLFQLGQSDV